MMVTGPLLGILNIIKIMSYLINYIFVMIRNIHWRPVMPEKWGQFAALAILRKYLKTAGEKKDWTQLK